MPREVASPQVATLVMGATQMMRASRVKVGAALVLLLSVFAGNYRLSAMSEPRDQGDDRPPPAVEQRQLGKPDAVASKGDQPVPGASEPAGKPAAEDLSKDAEIIKRLLALWGQQVAQVTKGSAQLRAFRYSEFPPKTITRERFEKQLASLDLADIPRFAAQLEALFPPLPKGGRRFWDIPAEIVQAGRNQREATTWDLGDGRASTNIVVRDGPLQIDYRAFNRQASVSQPGNLFVIGLQSLCYIPRPGAKTGVESFRITDRSDGKATLAWGPHRILADPDTGFLHQFVFGRQRDSEKTIWQFGPRTAGAGVVVPTLHVDVDFVGDKLQRLTMYHLQKISLNAEVPADTFVVAVPAGTNVVDFRESRDNPRRQVAREPVPDVVQYADAISPRSRSHLPVLKLGQEAPPLRPATWLDQTGVQDGSGAAARQRATRCLGQIGPEAKAAFPILLKLWQGATDAYQRGELATALKAVDAAAAAAAGVTAKPGPHSSPVAGEKPKEVPPEPAWKAAFRRDYGLKEGELLKRVAAPFPASRADYCTFLKAEYFPDMDFANVSISCRWDGKNVEFWSLTPDSGGVPMLTLLDCLGVSRQEVEVDEDWRFKQIPGEFVTRAGVPPEKVIPRLEQILREELKLPVRLALREVEREVILVGGKYESKPRANREANQVDLFAVKPSDDGDTPGGSGTFDEFLAATGSYLGRRLVNDLATTPTDTVRWYFHLTTRVLSRPDPNRDPAGVLKNITAQTGLTFKTEKRKVRVLFVEKG